MPKKKKAAKKESGSGEVFRCEICQISATNQDGLDMHNNGKKHQKKVAATAAAGGCVTPQQQEVPSAVA